MEKLFIYLLTAASASLLFHTCLATRMQQREAVARLGLRRYPKIEGAPLVNFFRSLLGEIGRRLRGVSLTPYRGWVSRKIVVAGHKGKLEAEELFAFQLVMGLIFPILFSPLSHRPVALLIFALAGLLYPCLWLNATAKRRQKEIRLSLAPAVDLISISVEAGLDFIASISRVVDRSPPGPLVDEFKTLLHEIQMGASREEALRHLADRCDDMSISSFAAILIQADRLGSSIGPALKAQAVKLRTERFQEAERVGAAASQKILLPLVFFIIPAVFIVIFAPIVLQLVTGGMKGMF